MVIQFFNKYKSYTSFRFLVAGIINTLFGIIVGILFLSVLPFHYTLTIFLSTVISVCFNYFTSLTYVFKKINSKKTTIRYFSVYLIMYLINMICISILINQFSMSDILAFALCSPAIIVLTYLLQKNIVFQNEKNINSNTNL
jgi:putative flippase GtrA